MRGFWFSGANQNNYFYCLHNYSFIYSIVIQVLQFLISLSILIVLHELGHFIPAKLFKTRVEKFFLFFDIKFALFKKQIGETVYGIGWLPLGGYVKISGMIDESMDTDQMAQEPQPWEFRSKPAWQRLIIMLGGVTVNFVLAVFIFIMMAWAYGEEYIPMESLKDGVWVVEEKIGDKAGIKTGDKILAVDGNPIKSFRSVFIELVNGYNVTLERNGQIIEKELPEDFIATLIEDEEKVRFLEYRVPFVIGEIPEISQNANSGLQLEDRITRIGNDDIKYFDQAKSVLKKYQGQNVNVQVVRNGSERLSIPLQVSDSATLGVRPGALTLDEMAQLDYFKIETIDYNFFQAFPAGINQGFNVLGNYVKQLGKIFNPSTGAYKGVGGFAAIAKMYPDTWNWADFWTTTAFISMILAFMNILPIPALDGGHVMFLLYEMVSGRKPADKFMEYAQMVGFFLLIALLLFANGNDIVKGIFG